jgi:hypothetical protein
MLIAVLVTLNNFAGAREPLKTEIWIGNKSASTFSDPERRW